MSNNDGDQLNDKEVRLQDDDIIEIIFSGV